MTTELSDALSEDNLVGLIKDLRRRLDAADSEFSKASYKARVEDDFWQTITGRDNPDDEVEYQALPDNAKDLVGHNEKDELPWWFESFEWRFKGIGSGLISVGDDDLSKLESFDKQNTWVEKPQLTDNPRGWVSLLDSLHDLRNQLETNTQFTEEQIRVRGEYESFDGQIFELGSRTVHTTQSFRDWAEEVLKLCPPHHPTTTALLKFNTGLPKRAMQGFLLNEFESIERAGLVSEGLVYNEGYRKAFTNLMGFNRAFDFTIKATISDSGESLEPGLERLYMDSWAKKAEQVGEAERLAIKFAKDPNGELVTEEQVAKLAKCALTLPISFTLSSGSEQFRYVTFDTHDRRRYGGFRYSSQQKKRAVQIWDVLRQNYELLPGEEDE